VGAMTVALFAMHGAAYLEVRTEGALRLRAHRTAWHAFGVFLAIFLIVTMVTLVEVPRATARLREEPWLWAVPVAAALAIANIPRTLFYGRPGQAFASSCVVIVALVGLLGAALFPSLVPSKPIPEHGLTLWNAASSPKTLGIMALVAGMGMPLVLGYTGLVYWTFRGKVRLDEGGY